MDDLRTLIQSHDDWLMDRVLVYAKANGFTAYTSTLAEAWRASICGLSRPLTQALERDGGLRPLVAADDYLSDPVAAFGVLEAQRHRGRGVTLGLFLGLMKYYRRAYHDLVEECGTFADERRRACLGAVDLFFDRVELAFCIEWATGGEAGHLAELQDANRRMTNEKNKYLTAFESLNDPVVLFDRDGLVENANLAAARTFASLGTPGAVYYAGEREHWLRDHVAELVSSAEPVAPFRTMLETQNGPRRFEVKSKPMLDVSDKFTGTVVILRDVTDEERTERALARTQVDLEDKVLKRTRDLEREVAHHRDTAETLRRTVDQLAASNTELERLAFVASHDLREPLRGVVTFSQLLQRRHGADLDGEAREFLDHIIDNGHRLHALMTDLLDYSRAAVGGGRFGPVDAGGALAAALDALRENVTATGATIRVRPLPTVAADMLQLAQLFQHLLANALKFSRPGTPPSITVSAERSGGFWEFSIADNGLGIEEPYRERIFEIFQRLHRTAEIPGTGIGLAMCRRIVERHGGRIWVEPAAGGGSTFRFTLPAAEVPADTAA